MTEYLSEKLLELFPEPFYVVDGKNGKLLFVSAEAIEILGDGTAYKGKQCHEYFHILNNGCGLCTKESAKPVISESYYSEKQGKYYFLKCRHADWKGHPIIVGVIRDVTKYENQNRELSETLAASDISFACIKILYRAQTPEQFDNAINETLRYVGESLNADRVYLFETCKDGKSMCNTAEWCAAGVASHMNEFQPLDGEILGNLSEGIGSDEIQGYATTDELRNKMPNLHNLLKKNGVDNIMTATFCAGGKVAGIFGADNLRHKPGGFALFQTLAYFIQSGKERIDAVTKLEKLSFVDTLTGLYNRNKYMVDLGKLQMQNPKTIGVAFLDINGLKLCNDTHGHAIGDKVLIEVAGKIKSCLEAGTEVYRVGGDEFVVLCPNIESDDFDRYICAMRSAFSNGNSCDVSVGYKWSDYPKDISALIKTADQQMYQNKQNYYRANRHCRNIDWDKRLF